MSDVARPGQPVYDASMIRVIDDAVGHIRGHPGMYLPDGWASPACYLARQLACDAHVLGAACVQSSRSADWWWVAADRDWIADAPFGIHELFTRIVAFPRAGVNSMRSDVLLTAFAEQVVTVAKGGRDVIRGEVTDTDPI